MPPERQWASWHIVEPTGSVTSAGAGFAPLLRRLPGGGPLARLAERFPAGADRAYHLVADNRSLLGRVIPEAVKRRADGLIASRAA
jgi:predicted DCC family thiol-disulfide oxidoreductase YuxK